MATVGTAYTVDRYVRTPEEVVAALFRDGPPPPPRPQPAHKRVWASLPRVDEHGVVQSGLDLVYDWLLNEVAERNPGLLVFGPDWSRLKPRRYRRAAKKIRERATCLVWLP